MFVVNVAIALVDAVVELVESDVVLAVFAEVAATVAA